MLSSSRFTQKPSKYEVSEQAFRKLLEPFKLNNHRLEVGGFEIADWKSSNTGRLRSRFSVRHRSRHEVWVQNDVKEFVGSSLKIAPELEQRQRWMGCSNLPTLATVRIEPMTDPNAPLEFNRKNHTETVHCSVERSGQPTHSAEKPNLDHC